jgi:hypothetical protein
MNLTTENLYTLTHNILDINTLMINRGELKAFLESIMCPYMGNADKTILISKLNQQIKKP